MDNKRSTRRSVNPPDSDQEVKSDSMSEVESILNDIESMVGGMGNEQTAKPTPVVDVQKQDDRRRRSDNPHEDSVRGNDDIGQLNVDLDTAIESELNLSASRDQPNVRIETAGPELGEIESSNGFDECAKASCRTLDATNDEVIRESSSGAPGVGDRILTLMSGPLPTMSDGSRIVWSLFALSLVVWVPLIWMIALTQTPLEDAETNAEGSGSLMISELTDLASADDDR